MLKFDGGRGCIICNKCRRTIRENVFNLMTKEHIERNSRKKHYCGLCKMKRLERMRNEREKID